MFLPYTPKIDETTTAKVLKLLETCGESTKNYVPSYSTPFQFFYRGGGVTLPQFIKGRGGDTLSHFVLIPKNLLLLSIRKVQLEAVLEINVRVI